MVFAFLVWNRVWFWQGTCSLIFLVQGHSHRFKWCIAQTEASLGKPTAGPVCFRLQLWVFPFFVLFVSHRMLLFWPYSPGPVPLHTIGVYVSQPSFNWLLLCWVLPFSVGSTRVTLLLGFLWRQGSRLATAGHFLLCYHRLRFLFLDQCFFSSLRVAFAWGPIKLCTLVTDQYPPQERFRIHNARLPWSLGNSIWTQRCLVLVLPSDIGKLNVDSAVVVYWFSLWSVFCVL